MIVRRMSKICLRHLQFAALSRGAGIRMGPEEGDEVKQPKASDIGRHLRSSYVGRLTLTPECIRGRPRHIESVVREMMKHADTIAVDRLEFSSVLFSPPDLTIATRLVKALLLVNHVIFDGSFPARSLDASKFELYPCPPRIMDNEILEYCKKKSASDSRRSVTFSYASITKDFVRQVAEARRCGNLPATLILWINSRSDNVQQDLTELEQSAVDIVSAPRQQIVSPDLVVGFDYDAERGHRHVAIRDQRSFAATYEKLNE